MRKSSCTTWLVSIAGLAVAFAFGAVVQAQFGIIGRSLIALGVRDQLAELGIVRPLPPKQTVAPVELAPDAVPCPTGRILSLVVAGQSNAANAAPRSREPSDPRIVVFHRGRCWAGVDPLPGATGVGASIWTALAHLIVPKYDAIILAPAAVGGTPIDQFARGGHHHETVVMAATGLQKIGSPPSAILWQHGETDAMRGTPKDYYQTYLASLVSGLRRAGIIAPVLVARSSRCGAIYSPAVRAAQMEWPGPDTDLLGAAYRQDGCHFNNAGRHMAAKLWFDALQASNIIN